MEQISMLSKSICLYCYK